MAYAAATTGRPPGPHCPRCRPVCVWRCADERAIERRALALVVAGCAAGAPAHAVTLGLGFAVTLGGGWKTLFSGSPALAALWSAVLGLSVGWARGIYEGITSGAPGRMKGIAGEAVFFGVVIVGGIVWDLAAAAVASVAFVAGHSVGGCWSTRQVADAEARRRLANPDLPAMGRRDEVRG